MNGFHLGVMRLECSPSSRSGRRRANGKDGGSACTMSCGVPSQLLGLVVETGTLLQPHRKEVCRAEMPLGEPRSLNLDRDPS